MRGEICNKLFALSYWVRLPRSSSALSLLVLPAGFDDLFVCFFVLVFPLLLAGLRLRGFACRTPARRGTLERVLLLKEYQEFIADTLENDSMSSDVSFAYENLAEIDNRRGLVGERQYT